MSLKRLQKNLDCKSEYNKELISEKLNNLFNYLDESYYINSGGCCYVSYLVAKLLQRDGFEFNLLIWSKESLPEKFEYLKYGNYHYAIQLGDNTINGDMMDEELDDDLYKKSYSHINYSKILSHYKKVCKINDWNDIYDKSLNSFISKMVKLTYESITDRLREG